ncbi:hypothetical protein ACA910_014594 [Epithemia clementina (nom. ined.)]
MFESRPKQRHTRRRNISPLALCWSYGRYCCCRFGAYPLVVAPILTVAFLASIYSSSGCKFTIVDIGFTPQPNGSWNTSTTSLGFWYRYIPDDDLDGKNHKYDPELLDKVHENCQWYTNEFEDAFIDNDRTWKVARIMARVAGGGSFASAFLAWTFVGPFFCPVGFLWPGVLLPLVMISFIAEGSKFLFFDMGICRNNIFREAGSDETFVPEPAESCTLGESAIQSIVAVSLLLIALLLVCLKVPDERQLDPHFGIPEEGTDPSEGDEYHHSRRHPPTNSAKSSRKGLREQPQDKKSKHSIKHPIEETSEYSSDDYNEDFEIPTISKESAFAESAFAQQNNVFPTISKRESPHNKVDSSFQSRIVNTMDSSFQSSNGETLHARKPTVEELLRDMDDDEEEGSPVHNAGIGSTSIMDLDDTSRISESRLSTLASVEKKAAGSGDFSTASSMLEDLVRDLNYSYSNPPPQFDGGVSPARSHIHRLYS